MYTSCLVESVRFITPDFTKQEFPNELLETVLKVSTVVDYVTILLFFSSDLVDSAMKLVARMRLQP